MFVPLSDITFKEPQARGRGGLNGEVGGGLFALRVSDGKQAWMSRPNGCGDRPSCSPALSAPAAVAAGAIFSGSIDGHFRAFSTTDGRVLWDFDTARDFDTVNGVTARGGSIDVGGPAIANGAVVTTSGYGQWGGVRQRAARVVRRRSVITTIDAKHAELSVVQRHLCGFCGFCACRRHASGRVIVTVVPAPRSLRTAIVPPMSSMLRFAIVNPRPVPVAFVEKYGSKILFIAS